MASLSIEMDISLETGGEAKGFEVDKTFSTTGKTFHDRQVNCAGGSSVTWQTIFDASVDLPSTFSCAYIITDPDGDRTSDQQVDIRVTNNSVTSIWRVSSNGRVMILGPSAQTTGALTKIEVGNVAGTTATTDDVLVRIVTFK